MIFFSGFSLPSARPGSISEPKSMERICITESGSGILKKNCKMYGTISGTFDERIYVTNFLA
jgi:hypothetical protein